MNLISKIFKNATTLKRVNTKKHKKMSSERAEALVTALKEAKDATSQRTAGQNLNYYAPRAGCLRDLVDAGLPSTLVCVFGEWEDREAKGHCACSISAMLYTAHGNLGTTDESREYQLAFVEAGVLEPLAEHLAGVTAHESYYFAMALHALVKNNEATAQRLRDVPGIMEVLSAAETTAETRQISPFAGAVDTATYINALGDILKEVTPSGRAVKAARAS